MEKQFRKIKKYLGFIDASRYTEEQSVGEITMCPCEYKTSHTPPPLCDFQPYTEGTPWGSGFDSHAWFHFTVDIPEAMQDKPVQLLIKSEFTGWDAVNPQCIAYLNGEMRQGLDVNHTFIRLEGDTHFDVYIYGYTGPRNAFSRFYARIRNLNEDAEQLYYDIRVPFEMLEYLAPESKEYADILRHLDHAVSLLDLYEIGSEDYRISVTKALAYMEHEFYKTYCAGERGLCAPTTVGIGHTHIDCAYRWTLKQTREKVQRSFSTVLELMKQYPEYKFMSSQAFLYQNLKEDAPALYAEVKKRIAEGRWECEGAMWVEADCNLSSGESLVRQILYGKTFFREEFGVENRILWLPDVFGYSAAMPQILRKSGVDWFVTSKISWNDTNTMPHDTFDWVGIDGTAIHTYFLTAQNQGRGRPDRHTTYVGTTAPRMVAGTWNRYTDKQLNNEALLTFGFGAGGGGPTADMLEMGRRTARGIPGAPLFKIDFAGDFLTRLEKKIEGNPLLPQWRGELYLEFHRGTYTTMARNKRNNRRAEFMFLDAEYLATLNQALNGVPFPKTSLHTGWESILTNQFHDIIPGSSIREVYEQSDIDYKQIEETGDAVIAAAKADIAAKLDTAGGYVVFNPHSFTGSAPVVMEGITAIVSDLPSKGYTLTKEYITTNSIVIRKNEVETNCFHVRFDEHMQIVSLYDKKNDREVLRSGAVGNEIRLYADHPDVYDAWEWQAYSLDTYIPLTALDSIQIVEDGARRGIQLLRPYKHSTITQTIWFWDNIPKIDFDTVADWHEHHIMVKAVFPVDINADKATYEIQFGTTERPTHKNTCWEAAKFEVCAHKFADLSEGGYGVSLINDCKYGYDIHDGVMMLSLLRSPTEPNEAADQGEIPFVYSICPHAGRLEQSDTAKLAYYLNYPVSAIRASGDTNILPTSYSACTLNCPNVICETIKEAEEGNGTILRMYESQNQRSHLRIKTDIPFKHAYLCNLMEEILKELPVVNGEILTDIRGFEILTILLR